MKNSIHIVFAGGGTCGHLFPGLAVARQLAADLRRVEITFVGSGKETERRHVQAAGFEYIALPSRPLPRRAGEAIAFVVENLAGYLAARRLLDEHSVDAVVGLGGYASVPVGRAAADRRVPLVLLEQNVVPGRANRWLARSAGLVCTSFEPTRGLLDPRCQVRLTGNPIRRFAVADTIGQTSTPPQLLVLGGSGGARSLNENVPRALYKLGPALAGWRIVHQSGEADFNTTAELYRKLGLEARVERFLSDIPELLGETSLAVCRAGGTTLAELAAAGVPAVLLPYPQAAADHQRKNADWFVRAGAARLVDEREVAGRLDDQLAAVLAPLVASADRRAVLSAAMSALGRPRAAEQVASLVWSLASSRARVERIAA